MAANTGEPLPTVVVEIKFISTNNLVLHTENCKLGIPLNCPSKELEKALLQMSGLKTGFVCSCEKTWKVMKLYNLIFQAWKVMKFKCRSWKFVENYVHGTKSLRQYSCRNNKAR